MASTEPVGMTALIPSDRPQIHTCPFCGARLRVNATSCRICGGPEPVPLEQSIRELLPSLDDDLAALAPEQQQRRPPDAWRRVGNWAVLGVPLVGLALWFGAWCLLVACCGALPPPWLLHDVPTWLVNTEGTGLVAAGTPSWWAVLLMAGGLLVMASCYFWSKGDDTWSRAVDPWPWAPWRC